MSYVHMQDLYKYRAQPVDIHIGCRHPSTQVARQNFGANMLFEIPEVSTLVLLGATIAFLSVLFLSKREKYTNLPPGPWGLPFIGNILMFQKTNRIGTDMTNLSKKYNSNVISLKLGSYRTYVLNSYDIIKEAMVDKAEYFSERPLWLTPKKRHSGIIFNKEWSDRRRFTLVSMRDFGLGKMSLDARIQEESGFLVEEIEKSNGKPVDLTVVLPFVTANVICSIIIGNRFDLDDQDFRNIRQFLTNRVRSSGIAALQSFVPVLNCLPKKQPAEARDGLLQYVRKWKVDHEATFDPDNIRDLVDLFIAESKKDGSAFEENDLLASTGELFGAGTETTSTTLSWALLFLIHNPDMQAKCQQEIKKEIGSRVPEYKDIKKMPYINGFMNEVQRVGDIAPTALWHCTKADTELAGYTIPKESIVIINMSSALRDPKYFSDPDTFNPDRWIDTEGNMTKNSAFIPFSLGKRVCLGEQLAKKEFFIFLVAMLQNFKFKMADEANPPSLDGVAGAIHGPGNFKLRAFKL